MDGITVSPKQRLHALAVQALQKFKSNEQAAYSHFRKESDKDLHLVLFVLGISQEEYDQKASQMFRDILVRDVEGRGIGLSPEKRTGSDAVADGAGHTSSGLLPSLARPSAPPSPGNADHTIVRKHPRRLPGKPVQNQPAVSKRILAKVSGALAFAILRDINCNGRPALQATAFEALEWSDSVCQMETEKIDASRKRIQEALIVKHFSVGLPPTTTLEEFYAEHPDEYRHRKETLAEVMADA